MASVWRYSPLSLEVVMLADEAFEEMMYAWSQALQLFKDVCEE
jgi:hypothetical protein